VYPYVFDTPVPDDSTRMRKYQTTPHPFVIEPPLDTRTIYDPGSSLAFDLILVGKAIGYLPYFIYTFERLGGRNGIGKSRGKFEVEKVSWVDALGNEGTIYNGEEKILANTFRPLTIRDLGILKGSKNLVVRYITPTRITYDGNLLESPKFHVVISSLLRRLANLAYFHSQVELELDFRGIIDRAKEIEMLNGSVKWYDWERYSARQDTKIKMGGFTGNVEYEGDLLEFLPFLKLGEVIHIGKGTVFGLGKYRIGRE